MFDIESLAHAFEMSRHLIFLFSLALLVLACIGLGYRHVRHAKEEQLQRERAKEAKAEAAARQAEDAEKARVAKIFHDLEELRDNAVGLYIALPGHVAAAEAHLDQAEANFEENLFSPFWDEIENAVKALGDFTDSTGTIHNLALEYPKIAKHLDLPPPRFPLERREVEGLTAGISTSDRLTAIIRAAQRSFEFSSIYEQRRTNQILVAGFFDLGQAIEQMGQHVSASLDSLGRSVDSLGSIGSLAAQETSEHNERVEEHHRKVEEALKTLNGPDQV